MLELDESATKCQAKLTNFSQTKKPLHNFCKSFKLVLINSSAKRRLVEKLLCNGLDAKKIHGLFFASDRQTL